MAWMTTVSTIRTARLELASLSSEFMEAVLAEDLAAASAILGSPVPEAWAVDVRDLFRMRLGQVGQDPSALPWLARAMLLAEPDRPVVTAARRSSLRRPGPPTPTAPRRSQQTWAAEPLATTEDPPASRWRPPLQGSSFGMSPTPLREDDAELLTLHARRKVEKGE